MQLGYSCSDCTHGFERAKNVCSYGRTNDIKQTLVLAIQIPIWSWRDDPAQNLGIAWNNSQQKQFLLNNCWEINDPARICMKHGIWNELWNTCLKELSKKISLFYQLLEEKKSLVETRQICLKHALFATNSMSAPRVLNKSSKHRASNSHANAVFRIQAVVRGLASEVVYS